MCFTQGSCLDAEVARISFASWQRDFASMAIQLGGSLCEDDMDFATAVLKEGHKNTSFHRSALHSHVSVFAGWRTHRRPSSDTLF